MNWFFPRQIFATLVIGFGAGVYPLARYANHGILTAVIAGALLSTVNIAVGYAAIEYAFNRSMTTFMQVVVGGMGVRLLVALAVMMFLITVARLHVAALTASMFSFYTVYLVLEILFIQKKILAKTSDDTATHR